MAGIPRSKNIEKVFHSVVSDAGHREACFQALERGEHGITAVAWLRSEPVAEAYERSLSRPVWLPSWIDAAAESARPGKLAAHEAGECYVLDLSSTFAVAPLAELALDLPSVLDVCAAPGGKGILAWRYCSPRVLIANEVIRKRTAPLISNYQRCLIDPAIVSSCDPGLLAQLLPQQVSLVIVDAPCSGQSLVLKGMAAPGAFHPATISMNERRQRRILANSAATVRPGGYLLYSTCTFSREENEDNVEWLSKKFPDFSTVSVSALTEYRSQLSEQACYRLFPHHGFGAGAFVALFRRAADANAVIPDETIFPETIAETVWPVWRSASIGGAHNARLASDKSSNRRSS